MQVTSRNVAHAVHMHRSVYFHTTSEPALKPAARLILKDYLFCYKFAWSRTGVATEDANAFFPSCRKCANFAVAPADLICLACAILLAVTVWKLTAFSADFGGRCGIYGVCDTEPAENERLGRFPAGPQVSLKVWWPGESQLAPSTKKAEGERLVRQWHYTPFTVEKTSKTGPACSV